MAMTSLASCTSARKYSPRSRASCTARRSAVHVTICRATVTIATANVMRMIEAVASRRSNAIPTPVTKAAIAVSTNGRSRCGTSWWLMTGGTGRVR